jgi:hypothetical protein
MTDCPVITPAELHAIHQTAKAFDLRETKASTKGTTGKDNSDSPGSRFNAAHTVDDILVTHGWKEDRRTTAGMGFTRPGKDSGTSGVLLNNGNFYVFSSNAAPLEPGRSYDAFGLFTAYNHGGDFATAARELAGSAPKASKIEEWPEPLALPDELLPVAPFDFDLLPETFQAWAKDICDRLQCPPVRIPRESGQ